MNLRKDHLHLYVFDYDMRKVQTQHLLLGIYLVVLVWSCDLDLNMLLCVPFAIFIMCAMASHLYTFISNDWFGSSGD